MSYDETITFASDEEVNQPVAPGTIARIQVRPDREGILGEFRTGESQYGPWMVIPFEVVDGEHKGTWASTLVSLNGKDRKFRAVFKVVTGQDISQGGTVSLAEFKEKLVGGVFEAELEPEKRKGEPTGYTSVRLLKKRVGEREARGATPGAGLRLVDSVDDGASAPDSSDDIPF